MLIICCVIVIIGASLYFITLSQFASVAYFKNQFKQSGYFDMDKIQYAFFQEVMNNMLTEINSPKGRLLAKHFKETRTDAIETLADIYFGILIYKIYSDNNIFNEESGMIKKYSLHRAVISK